FLYENLAIQNNVIHQSYVHGVKKLMFLGSSCIYPKLAPQPIKEEYLLTGPLEPTNEPYAIAKIAGIKLCEAYHDQYGCNFISVMPTNLYGYRDNYHPEHSHVLPALLRRLHEAKVAGQPTVTVWGSGTPMREFLFADDLADACVCLMEYYHGPQLINIGTGEDLPIRELAGLIKSVVGYEGELVFDASKPDGTPRKLMDVSKLHRMGWRHTTPLEEGVRLVYQDFLAHHDVSLSGGMPQPLRRARLRRLAGGGRKLATLLMRPATMSLVTALAACCESSVTNARLMEPALRMKNRLITTGRPMRRALLSQSSSLSPCSNSP